MLAAMLKFEVKPVHRNAFVEALIEHGRVAAPTEPHMLRFDLIEDQGNPNQFLLYEAYADADAFGVHLQGASHQQLVQLLSENDWLTVPLAGPPRPFAPFLLGLGQSTFMIEEARR